MKSGNKPSPFTHYSLLIILLILGLGIRLYDLGNPPLDFAATRQLRCAIIARGMYYQLLPTADPVKRQQEIAFWKSTGQYEPPIIERIVAATYLVSGGEKLWIPRLYSSLFWLIGGAALYALARRLASWGAALVALGYYLLLPFAVQASRSFQPDPWMVMWIILAVYALYRWSETCPLSLSKGSLSKGGLSKPLAEPVEAGVLSKGNSWKWAIAAGLLAGIAALIKIVAAYIIGGAAVAIVLYTLGIKRFWRSPQVWSMAALMVTPTLIYYLSSTRQGHASEYFTSWTIALSHLVLEPSFYLQWLNYVQDLVGLTPLLLALIGIAVIASARGRALLLGLWIGYGLYGLFLPYQMYTHSYYHLQLVPIVALSLAPVAQIVLDRVSQQGWLWQALFAAIVLVGVAYTTWVSTYTLSKEDYRNAPAYWQGIANAIPQDGKIIALTQDYGYRLMYFGERKVDLWPTTGEQNLSTLRGSVKEFEKFFSRRTEGKKYFLVTDFDQFEQQPELKQTLTGQYPITSQGDGYLIFTLPTP